MRNSEMTILELLIRVDSKATLSVASVDKGSMGMMSSIHTAAISTSGAMSVTGEIREDSSNITLTTIPWSSTFGVITSYVQTENAWRRNL